MEEFTMNGYYKVIQLIIWSYCTWSITHAEQLIIPKTIMTIWEKQDSVSKYGYQNASKRIINNLSPKNKYDYHSKFDRLAKTKAPDQSFREIYLAARHANRVDLLAPYLSKMNRIVFAKHKQLDEWGYQFTETPSDWGDSAWYKWSPGTAICMLTISQTDIYGKVDVLINDPTGVLRDPDISFDGKKMIFSWKKTSRTADDFHLYEMDLATRQIRQLTFGLGYSDYEPCYLPNGDILFNSTRCMIVTPCCCWANVVSNFFICDQNGNFMRRVGFDQVHTNYPHVLPDGQVMYTRWEYNDRGNIFSQPLFIMKPDGSGQTELYGNQSTWPTSILQARGIPGTRKVVGVLGGHHAMAYGKLAVIDPTIATNYVLGESARKYGIFPIAPESDIIQRNPVDSWGITGPQFQHPFPLDEQTFITGWAPQGSRDGVVPKDTFNNLSLYFCKSNGTLEPLAADPKLFCTQPVVVEPRNIPKIASLVDYRVRTGTFIITDVYQGDGMKGVPRGLAKKIRVIGLEYRAEQIAETKMAGPQFHGMAVGTPVAPASGPWDVKVIIGEADIYPDGSAAFVVPAKKPVYFQVIDTAGKVIQTMRSWSTLMPSEQFSCLGCHESKIQAVPPPSTPNKAIQSGGPFKLRQFYGPPRGFSYLKEIQPIFNAKCISCHNEIHEKGLNLKDTRERYINSGKWAASYMRLTSDLFNVNADILNGKYVNYLAPENSSTPKSPLSFGSRLSNLILKLEQGHKNVQITKEELEKLCCWIDLMLPYKGDFTEEMSTTNIELYNKRYNRRIDFEINEEKRLNEYVKVKYGPNAIAASCRSWDINTTQTQRDGQIIKLYENQNPFDYTYLYVSPLGRKVSVKPNIDNNYNLKKNSSGVYFKVVMRNGKVVATTKTVNMP